MATKLFIRPKTEVPVTGLIVTEKNFKSLHNFVVGRGKGSLELRKAGGYYVTNVNNKSRRVAEVGDAIVRTIVDGVHKFEVIKLASFVNGDARIVGE